MYLETYIESETALLAKECGFPQSDDIPVRHWSDMSYWGLIDDKWELNVGEAAEELLTAPSHGQLTTWLRRNHGLVVEVDHMEGFYFFMVTHTSDHTVFLEDEKEYDIFEDAKERGLFAALQYIKSNESQL